MIKNFKFIIAFLLLALNSVWGNEGTSVTSQTLNIDTSFVRIKIPENEKDLFKDCDYSRIKSSYNPLTALINHLITKFFKNISEKNLIIVRQIIIWTIVIIGLIIIYFILKKYGWGLPIVNDEKMKKNQVLFSDIDKPLNQYDFEKIIKNFIEQKNYRMAFRWFFILLLHEMEKKQHLRFEPGKTINDLKNHVKDKSYYHRFADICLIFEYIWYGKFDVDEKSFEGMKYKIMELRDEIGK